MRLRSLQGALLHRSASVPSLAEAFALAEYGSSIDEMVRLDNDPVKRKNPARPTAAESAREMQTNDIDRFLRAQAPVHDRVLDELRAGRKTSHWMWFVFPQIRGLGESAMAQLYAISSLTEARAYLDHPVLGPRLRECTALANRIEGRSARDIFGSPDDMKFRSCMTLFALATLDNGPFFAALAKYFAGVPDAATLERLTGP